MKRDAGWAAVRIAALAFLFAAAGPIPATAQFGDLDVERSVRDVDIHGNKSFGEGTLKKILRTHGRGGFPFFRKRPLRPDYIRFDRIAIQDYYRRKGFLSASVDSVPLRFDKSGNNAEVHFYITEGPRVHVESVRFEGVGPIPESRLTKLLELKPGDPLDIAKQDLSREAVRSEYGEKGYVAAVVRDSLEVESTRVRIVYRIEPGPPVVLDSLHVLGTAVTKPKFVSREVTIDHGELLRRSKLLRSQQRIFDTGFYSDVRFDRGDIDSATNSADLIVDVRERKMGWIDAGIGYGTVDQLRLTSQLGQRNIWRDGVRFVATGLLGVRMQGATSSDPSFPYFQFHRRAVRLGDSRIDLAATRPWNFGFRVSTTIGAYAEHIIPRGAGAAGFPPYRAYGGSGTLGYDFSLHTRGRLSYEHRRVVSDTLSLLSTSADSLHRYTKNGLAASLERDTRDNPFDAHQGMDAIGTGEFVGGALQGSAQYLKTTATVTRFLPVNRPTTAAFRVRMGLINPQVAERAAAIQFSPIELIPVEERFFLGGATTVRGYGENELGTRAQKDTLGHALAPARVGGRVLLLVNAELRRQLVGPIGAEFFFDGGNVWVRPSDIHLRNLLSFADRAGYNDMRYSVGVGLRFATPLGPVRFDYGWKIRMAQSSQRDPSSDTGKFHFSVGQAF